MQINPLSTQINFGHNFNTINILEVTTQRVLGNNGLEGSKDIISKLYGNGIQKIGIGNRGYKYYAEILGQKITEKYPEIKQATDEINKIINEDPFIKKQALQQKIHPILKKLGSSFDITI